MSDSLLTADQPSSDSVGQAPADTGVTAAAAPAVTTAQSAASPDATAQTDAKEAKPEAPAIPEKYEFKAPEGLVVDAATTEEFSGIAKELGLTQENAQRVFDMGAKLTQRMAEQFQTVHQQTVAQWSEAAKTDAEFGGVKLADSLAVAKKALDAFGTPALRQVLEQSGLGNHPEVIRAFLKVGREVSEDRVLRGGDAASAPKSHEARLYPNLTH